MNPGEPSPTIYAIGPTPSVVAELRLFGNKFVSYQVSNLSSDVMVGRVFSRLSPDAPMAYSGVGDFQNLNPGESVSVDLDTTGKLAIGLEFYAQGIGGDIAVLHRRVGP